jgi:hypothetical protein
LGPFLEEEGGGAADAAGSSGFAGESSSAFFLVSYPGPLFVAAAYVSRGPFFFFCVGEVARETFR